MIEIGLYKTGGIISRLIRWQTRGEYSHAALLFDGETSIEAWHKGGVQEGPIGHLHSKGTQIDVYEIDAPHCEGLIREYADAQVGKPYDFMMVARFMSRRGETKRSKGKLFCSELVYMAMEYGGVDLFHHTEAWEVSPDLLKRSPLLKKGRTIIV